MVIEMGRGNGVTAFRAAPRDGKWTTENVWHTDEVSMHMSDAVVVDGVLYGLSHLNSGRVLRARPRHRQGALEERAAAGRARRHRSRRQHDLLARRRRRTGGHPAQPNPLRADHPLPGLATSATWTQPAISGNRVFVKDVSSLTLWTIE